MKKVILLLFFLPSLSYGQIGYDFENGAIEGWTESTAGRWKADTEKSLSGIYSLHHIFDNPSGGADCIGIPLTNLHPSDGTVKWSFLVRHGYDPSSSNSWALWLMSDQAPSDFNNGSSVSGFAAGVNLYGYDDTLRIWKISNGSPSVVASSHINWQTTIGINTVVKVTAERSAAGEWQINVTGVSGNFIGGGMGHDQELFNAEWLILNYRYTSTRDRLLWFDDLSIEGVFYDDKIPPSVKSHRITGRSSLEIEFSEDPADTITDPSLFILSDGENKAVSVVRKSPGTIVVTFKNDFINKEKNHLVIQEVCDRKGNCVRGLQIDFSPVWMEHGDIIISELMIDPSPSVSLPEKEYIELKNNTSFIFRLTNSAISTLAQKSILPDTEIGPDEYLILCPAADTQLFSRFGQYVGIKPFPALIDDGGTIWLSDSTGSLIHGVEYSKDWYGENLKDDGGWSLEMIDSGHPFYSEGNWEASSSGSGGTPGKINSASRSNPDRSFEGILNVFPDDSGSIILSLSETLFDLQKFPEKILVDERPSLSVSPVDPLLRKFLVAPAKHPEPGEENSLFLTGEINDFSGNEIYRRSFKFGIPGKPGHSDILFNEILFNPLPGEPDFIEFYNSSELITDVSRLYLASVNTDNGDTSEISPVFPEPRCFLPGTFFCITTDPGKTIERYPYSDPEKIFRVPSLPSLPDDKGHLLLLNRELELIDEVIYSEKMHYSLLDGKEGVSLEKIRPELNSGESTNWHSASEVTGWGTPGSQNSVYNPAPFSDDRIILSSGRITPDNDGYEDVLVVDLQADGPGNIVSISIYNETGVFVKRIAENFLAGESASFIWDATAGDGSLVGSGIYIFLIELFNDRGKVSSWKKVCSVIRDK